MPQKAGLAGRNMPSVTIGRILITACAPLSDHNTVGITTDSLSRELLLFSLQPLVLIDCDHVLPIGGADDVLEFAVIQPIEGTIFAGIDDYVSGAAVGVGVHHFGALGTVGAAVERSPVGLHAGVFGGLVAGAQVFDYAQKHIHVDQQAVAALAVEYALARDRGLDQRYAAARALFVGQLVEYAHAVGIGVGKVRGAAVLAGQEILASVQTHGGAAAGTHHLIFLRAQLSSGFPISWRAAMSTFKAVYATQQDGKVQIAIQELDRASLPAGDVLVRVEYSDLNYKDGLAVTGRPGVIRKYPMIPGVALAGVVEESSSPDWHPGDEVVVTGFGLSETAWGGYAELARMKAEWLVRLPNGITLKQAMAIGTAGFTAMQCVVALERHGLVAGSSREVLVTGAAGGVGSIAVAILAKLGYRVAASTGRAELGDYLRSLGASEIVDRA